MDIAKIVKNIYVQDVMFAFYTIDKRYCAKAALVMENIYTSRIEQMQEA